MTTYVLVPGAWHGPWAWDGVAASLRAAGATVRTPGLLGPGLHDDAATVAAELGHGPGPVVLVGHSYAGLVVREAADRRPEAVAHVVLVDGWAGPDGTALLDLAPEAFRSAVRAAASGGVVPAPPPAAFGVLEPGPAAELATRLVPQPLRTFTEPTHLTGAVDRIPGTAICCRPATYPFAEFGAAAGYRVVTVDGPHDLPVTHPGTLARALLAEPALQ